MTDPAIAQAVTRWEEARRAGQDPTPAELLPDQPELHAPLRAAIDNLRGASRRDVHKGKRWPFQFTLIWLAVVIGPPVAIACLIYANSPRPFVCELVNPPNANPWGVARPGIEPAQPIHGIAFHPNGKTFVAVGTLGYIGVWDARRMCEVDRFLANGSFVQAVAFSFDGQILACGNEDRDVRLFNARGDLIHSLWVGTPVCDLSFDKPGRLLITARNEATLIDPATRTEIRKILTPDQLTRCGGISPDGKLIATGGTDNVVYLWDAATGAHKHNLEGHTGTVLAVAFSPDGSRLASASADRTVKVWDVATCRVLCTVRDHIGEVSAVCFSPDGNEIASGDRSGIIQVSDSRTGREIQWFAGAVRGVNALCFSPNGQDIIYGGEGGLRRRMK
jgi:WD40 repeat protein